MGHYTAAIYGPGDEGLDNPLATIEIQGYEETDEIIAKIKALIDEASKKV